MKDKTDEANILKYIYFRLLDYLLLWGHGNKHSILHVVFVISQSLCPIKPVQHIQITAEG